MTWAWIGLKLLGVGQWLKEAAGSIWAWVRQNPSLAIIIALCALLALSQWHDRRVIAGKDHEIVNLTGAVHNLEAASAANLKAQLDQKAAVERHYKDIADEADQKHTEDLADANGALARYIATHRVQPADSGSGSADPSAESGSTGVPENSAAQTGLVAVTEKSLHACTDDYAYARAAYDWAAKLSVN